MAERETERERGEALLRGSERHFPALFENSSDIFTILEQDGTIRYASPSVNRLLGYTPEELAGVSVYELLHPEDRPSVRQLLGDTALTGPETVVCELRVRHGNGSWRYLQSEGSSRLHDPMVAGYLVNSRDITERKLTEEALYAAEARYQSIWEHALDGIFQSSPSGHYLSANPALARIYGYDSPAELMEVLTDIARQLYVKPGRRAEFMRLLREHDTVSDFRSQVYRRDGKVIWISENARAVRDRGGRVLYYEGMVQDITERIQLEEQLRQSQKMDALGRLAGGIAHDFNNMLAVINGYTELLLDALEETEPSRKRVLEIQKAGERAAALTRQLLTFSRREVAAPQVVNLNEVVTRMDQLLRRLIGEDVTLATVLHPEPGLVRIDAGQIEQVIMNLAVNARDAMARGGMLTIETQHVVLETACAGVHSTLPPGAYSMLSVSDTGSGMDADTRSRMFEPFFTTKNRGKGTGLGLATVYGIVCQHQGGIWVYSEPGAGTTLKIYFPLAAGVPRRAAEGEGAAPVQGGHERILLVEDEELVRMLVRDVLRERGYTVQDAPDAETALELCARDGLPDLVVTDVVMPGMNGRELAEILRSRQPDLGVLFMSGYTDDAVIRHGILQPDVPYLQKPFAPAALARKVRELLDSRALCGIGRAGAAV